jgi:putative nucleotidyltransferase with HDIG domain
MKTVPSSSPRPVPHAAHGPAPSVAALFERIADRSALAAGAQDIIRLANHSPDDLSDLQRLVQPDASLVALLLRRVNSSFYRLDQPVCDLTTAAQLLGFREFRNLAITVYLSRMFHTPVEPDGFSTRQLWNHGVAVAAASQMVARVCGCGAPADAYIAGLLHDIGLLLLSQQMRGRFEQVIQRVRWGTPTPQAEREIYDFHHAQLGGYAARRWEFPPAIVDAIEHHHGVEAYHGPHGELVHVVAVANYLCSRAGWTSLGVHNVPLPPDAAYRMLGLDEVALAVIWDELRPTLDSSAGLANV